MDCDICQEPIDWREEENDMCCGQHCFTRAHHRCFIECYNCTLLFCKDCIGLQPNKTFGSTARENDRDFCLKCHIDLFYDFHKKIDEDGYDLIRK